MQPFIVQLIDLTIIQLANWRWSWRRTLITGMVAPIGFILMLGVFAADSGEAALGHVLTGNIVITLIFESQGKTGSNFSFMRFNGMLDYMATLPIHRIALIIGTVISFLLLSLPAIATTLIVGTWMLDLTLRISPMILIVIPLVSLSLSGLGALVGLLGRTPEEVNSMNNLILFILMTMGPVVIPLERLPQLFQVLGLFSPATYAASALRQVVLGMPDRIPLAVNIMMLAAISSLLLWFVSRRMDWRQL